MKILFVFTELNQKFGALRSQHGLAFLSAVLKQNGYSDVSLSYFSGTLDLAQWAEDLRCKQPDLIGFYSTAEQFHFIKKLIEVVPQPIFTIGGGPHPSCYPLCLEAIPRLDAICVGEGEYPLLELVQALEQGRDYSQIKSLWVRRNGEIIKNPTRPFIHHLDELPFEDRELFNTQEAINQYGLSQLRILASRGCPFSCTFCSNKRMSKTQSGPYVRFRSADHLLEELNQLKRKYRFEEIFFDDDIFIMNREIVMEFCQRYPQEIGKPFVFAGRVEACRQDILTALKKAGGRRIDFGVESGHEELRRSILKRKMSNRQIIEATQLAQRVGLQVKTLNMVGLPEETPEKFKETIRINQAIKPEVASLYVFYPYPGTELYDYCLEKGYLHPEESLPENYISRRDSILELPYFPKKAINQSYRWFAFQVFWSYSPIKAIGYTLINSKHGEFFMAVTKKFRNILRKFLKGF
jgi:anaerobic magnesium-protoporphyrin IX monomethyl ester cyclase